MKLEDIKPVKVKVAEGSDENATLGQTPPTSDTPPLMTTAQAAKEMRVTQSRVRQFIGDGRLHAKRPKKGRRDNFLSADEVHKFAKKDRKRTGRPPEKTSKTKH